MIVLICRLDALDKNAHAAYQASSDLRDVVERCLARKDGAGSSSDSGAPKLKRDLSIRASLMTPVKPMLVSYNAVKIYRK